MPHHLNGRQFDYDNIIIAILNWIRYQTWNIVYTYSLPEAQLQQQHERARRHIEYDDAHQTNDDCTERYLDCPTSIWHAGFLIDLSDEDTKKRLLRDNVLAATFNKL